MNKMQFTTHEKLYEALIFIANEEQKKPIAGAYEILKEVWYFINSDNATFNGKEIAKNKRPLLVNPVIVGKPNFDKFFEAEITYCSKQNNVNISEQDFINDIKEWIKKKLDNNYSAARQRKFKEFYDFLNDKEQVLKIEKRRDFNNWIFSKWDWNEISFQHTTGKKYQHPQDLKAVFFNAYIYYQEKCEKYYNEFKELPIAFLNEKLFEFRQHFSKDNRVKGIVYYDELIEQLIEKYNTPPQQNNTNASTQKKGINKKDYLKIIVDTYWSSYTGFPFIEALENKYNDTSQDLILSKQAFYNGCLDAANTIKDKIINECKDLEDNPNIIKGNDKNINLYKSGLINIMGYNDISLNDVNTIIDELNKTIAQPQQKTKTDAPTPTKNENLYNEYFRGNTFLLFKAYCDEYNIDNTCRTDLSVLFQLFSKYEFFVDTMELKHYLKFLNKYLKYDSTELKKVNLNTKPNIVRTNNFNRIKNDLKLTLK